jgi:signal peptide peptidase SppA
MSASRLNGLAHAQIALMDSIWLIEPHRAQMIFEALRGVEFSPSRAALLHSSHPTYGLQSAYGPEGGSKTIADGSYEAPQDYKVYATPEDGRASLAALSSALIVTEDGADPSDLVARDKNGWGLGYYRVGTVAVIQIEGPMQKADGWCMEGTSTTRVRRTLRRAVADELVLSILILVDSPGGTVAGTHDTAMDVRKAAMQKPVYAYCEDMCCSAAYYVASQANAVYAGPGAMVGSIGVYATLYDLSGMAEAEGIVVHVVKDGEEKGDGMPGTPITPQVLERTQALVDTYGTQFRKTVSETRFPGSPLQKGVSPARGDVFIGAQARTVGLVDGITTLDKVLAAMKKNKKPLA